MVRLVSLVLLAACMARTVSADDASVEAGMRPALMPYGAQQFDMQSKSVGDTYRIYVGLPPTYAADTSRRYPVLFVLDGNGMFGTALEIVHVALLAHQLPEIIVVGVGYAVPDFTQTFQVRGRDYAPLHEADGSPSQGPAKFLSFLRDELKPLLQSRYRVNRDDTALFGDSLAGGFALFTLFTAPETFNRYAIASPAVGWRTINLHADEEAYAKRGKRLAARVYMSIGADEDPKYVGHLLKLDKTLRERGYEGLWLKTELFGRENHHSVVPVNLARGLREVYCDPPRADGCGPDRSDAKQ